MAILVSVEQASDERLNDYVRLREATLRRSLEAEQGLFIAEGEKVIRRAVQAGFPVRSFLLTQRWVVGLTDVLDSYPAPVYVVTEQLAEQVTGFHVHRGALASLERRQQWSLEQVLELPRLVVCEDIVDHTNVGAIIRCAAGLGWDGVLIAPRCADPLYRRAIKTSMGAVFSMPWARLSDWHGAVQLLKDTGHEVAALALSEDAQTLPDYARARTADRRPIALLVGTEGAGLSRRWVNQADAIVQIPMFHGIDSLNVAAATAIACYQLAGHETG